MISDDHVKTAAEILLAVVEGKLEADEEGRSYVTVGGA